MSRPALAFVLTALSACGGPPTWQKELAPLAEEMPVRRGLRVVRGPIHLHTPYSHDACDGNPRVDGQPNYECMERLRSALCRTHQDYAMLTDHGALLEETEWDALFLPGPGDEPVMEGGQHVASFMACPDGTRVLIQVGSENELMPLGLTGHLATTPAERGGLLRGGDAATAAVMRAHGALVAIPHGEAHSLEQMRAVEVDATEIYNLHANLGPDIRAEMGLDPLAPINALLPFITGEEQSVDPDLIFLLVWEENPIELGRLEALWGEGRHVTATLGVDSHENVISGLMSDGERGDSHRRLLRWFSNHLLVAEGALTPQAVKGAIEAGRGYGAFEIFGVPVGFDYRAETSGGTREMGDTVALGSELLVAAPRSDLVGPADLRLRLLRVDPAGAQEIATHSGDEPLRVRVDLPGAYRAEVRVRPRGFGHLLGGLQVDLERERVWIYSNPIYVQ